MQVVTDGAAGTRRALTDRDSREFAEWFSIWSDLLYARQVLYSRDQMPNIAANVFTRRALWDAAVVAYGRCFNTGVRRALLKQFVDTLSAAELARHTATLKWRDKHAGHRVDPKLEKSAAVGYFAADGRLVKVESEVTPTVAPEAEASTELQDLLSTLMNRVWEQRLTELEQRIRDSYNSRL